MVKIKQRVLMLVRLIEYKLKKVFHLRHLQAYFFDICFVELPIVAKISQLVNGFLVKILHDLCL